MPSSYVPFPVIFSCIFITGCCANGDNTVFTPDGHHSSYIYSVLGAPSLVRYRYGTKAIVRQPVGPSVSTKHEVWYYPKRQLQVYFIDGWLADVNHVSMELIEELRRVADCQSQCDY